MPKTRSSARLATLAGLAFSIAAMLPCPAASAQNALGDGTALDANLQVGSGGKNTRVRDIDAQARFNNAVVTGNVPFGRGLRSGRGAFGEVPLGSNSLFRFELDSYASALAGRGVSATDSLRYQFALATGQYVPEVLGASGAIYRPGVSPSTALPASTALRATSDYLATQALRPSVAGYRTGQDGSIYSATASPLLGVGWIRMQDPSRQSDTQRSIVANPNLGAASLSPDSPTDATLSDAQRLRESGIPGMPNPPQGYEGPMPRESAVFSGLESATSGITTPLQASAQLGGRVDTAGRIITRTSQHQRLVEAIDTAYKPYDPSAKPETQSADQPGDKPAEPGQTPDASKPSQPGTDMPSIQVPAWERELNDLRERLRKRGITPPSPPTPESPDTQPGNTRPGAQPSTPGAKDDEPTAAENPGLVYQSKALGLDIRTVRALRDAGVRFDKLTAEGASQNPQYQRHMQAGQELLADGRYFDAEDRFLRALSASPGDPMAAVGRMHAQLGGGLFLSAAMNLRDLFREHPEMVAAKYGSVLRPSPERTELIAAQLRAEMGKDDSAIGRDAALLLAYLGQITDNAAMVKEGLDTLSASTKEGQEADRTLIMLLKGVWEPSEGAKSPGSGPAPAADGQ